MQIISSGKEVVKTRDKSKKRAEILDAAVLAFTELGFDRASMDYIAEKATASKRTVYNHFASKELLFNAVITRFIQDAAEQKQIKYDADTPLEEQLYRFADLKINLSTSPEQLGFMRMAFGVMITHPEISDQVMENTSTNEDGFQNWLLAAVADKKLKIEDVSVAAEVFWSMFSSSFFWMPLLQGPVDSERTQRLKEEFVATFLAKYSA